MWHLCQVGLVTMFVVILLNNVCMKRKQDWQVLGFILFVT